MRWRDHIRLTRAVSVDLPLRKIRIAGDCTTCASSFSVPLVKKLRVIPMCGLPSLLILAAACLAAIVLLPPVLKKLPERRFARRMHGFGGYDGRDWVDLRRPTATDPGGGGGWGDGMGVGAMAMVMAGVVAGAMGVSCGIFRKRHKTTASKPGSVSLGRYRVTRPSTLARCPVVAVVDFGGGVHVIAQDGSANGSDEGHGARFHLVNRGA